MNKTDGQLTPSRTHKALVDTDFTTGRKLINHYEIIEELGRGVHGKVKLAKNLETNENVAIKIIPRFSKRRRLGKVTAMSTQDKSKKEIAILKKIRHPNIVALLEVIDDPELKKIYMVLEHVELGEIVWRKKGLPHICAYERRRVEREGLGLKPGADEERYELSLERRQALKDAKRAKITRSQHPHAEYWSLEYGGVDDDDVDSPGHSLDTYQSRSSASNPASLAGSRAASLAPSRNQSYQSVLGAGGSRPPDSDCRMFPGGEGIDIRGNLRSNPSSSTALDGFMYGAYDDPSFGLGGRSPSMPDSIISHMSSVDYNRQPDPYADDYSYVPCFTFDQARNAFRDTVLGLEYLHYEGVVHRDIKPANLLWTRDHRVKISDFGVSYFGRPIREGEPDETLSESEARDFDNDLELAKTVGTPAFFAPELCYTEALDDSPGHSQPKVTEQIDVWSLGVTLYCLIFARIPFLAEDEWQMFRKIATEEPYIPFRRLRPVDPSTKPDERSLYTRVNRPPYRDDQEPAYEDVDPELRDLLTRMLTKAPDKRIKLRDVKRHSWVVRGIDNVQTWLEETEPARRTAGRRIQVDAREMERAVVPLTFLERARSVVKKAVGRVIHPRAERTDSTSRKRATSSAASSAGDSLTNFPPSPHFRDYRRRSLRGDLRSDDYFAGVREQPPPPSEHPLTYSVTASPQDSPSDDYPVWSPQQTVTRHDLMAPANITPQRDTSRADQQVREATVGQKPMSRHAHARSISNAFLSLTPALHDSQTVPQTPVLDGAEEEPSNSLRKARDMRSAADDTSRARSVDRGFFANNDKRAETKVSLSTVIAPGAVHVPPRLRKDQFSDLSPSSRGTPPSPLPGTSRDAPGYRNSQPNSDPDIRDKQQRDTSATPITAAHRVSHTREVKTPPPRTHYSFVPESFLPAFRFGRGTDERSPTSEQQVAGSQYHSRPDPHFVPLPLSPDDHVAATRSRVASRDDTIVTAGSSSSASMGVLGTPLTSPSETASPARFSNRALSKDNREPSFDFQSNPSLPALLSSTSSVSADLEGEFLGSPGVLAPGSILDTTDSLTPPAMTKEPIAGFPLGLQEQVDQGAVPIPPDRAFGRPRVPMSPSASSHRTADDEDDEDSGSDEGLIMAKSKKKHFNKTSSPSAPGRVVIGSRRRDTGGSIGSTDTAKKLVD